MRKFQLDFTGSELDRALYEQTMAALTHPETAAKFEWTTEDNPCEGVIHRLTWWRRANGNGESY